MDQNLNQVRIFLAYGRNPHEEPFRLQLVKGIVDYVAEQIEDVESENAIRQDVK